MKKESFSKALFIGVLLILIVNTIISAGNLIEEGAVFRSVVPLVSWSIATIGWMIYYLKRNER